jgi:tetratricopeptide (TPR) repeat protein
VEALAASQPRRYDFDNMKLLPSTLLLLLLFLTTFLFQTGCTASKNRNEAEFFYNTGKAQITERKYEEAILSFEKSIELNDKDPNVYAGLGWAHFSIMNFDKAKAYWEKAIKISPNPDALLGRGYIFLMNNDFESAKNDFQLSIGLNPKNSSAHLAMGRVYYRQGFAEKAITELNEAININPNERMAYWVLSEIFKGQGENELSLKYKKLGLD